MKKEFLLKHWAEILAIFLASISLAVSFKSCSISRESNEIAREALNESKNQFSQVNKPILDLTPVRFDESNTYLKVEPQKESINFFIRYKAENVGNVTAREISIPQTKKKFSITPGNFKFFETTISVITNQENITETYIKEVKQKGVKADFTVDYSHDLDSGIRYRVYTKNLIFEDKALILESDNLQVNGIND